MKKLIAAVFFLGLVGVVKADETPKLLADFGVVKVYIPLTSINVVNQFDFVGKRALVGGETALGSFSTSKVIFTVTGGAVTSLDGQGAPFIGTDVSLVNPLEAWIPLAQVHPGLFAGRDFNQNVWVYGLKFSMNIF